MKTYKGNPFDKPQEPKQCDIHVVGSSFYTLEEWGQGSPNRGIIGTYKTREDAEKDRTDDYWQHIKEHKFK